MLIINSKQIKMTLEDVFQEKIVEVSEAFPSIYTKDDVVKLLINIKNILEDVEPSPANFGAKLENFQDEVTTTIRRRISQYDYDDSVNLELRNHNEIHYDIDTDGVEYDVESAIEEMFNDFKKELEIVEEVEED